MSFADDVAAFRAKVLRRQHAITREVGLMVYDSIVNGSALTGAPGQPVQEGELKGSWTFQMLGPTEALISTNHPGAQAIEHGVKRIPGAGVSHRRGKRLRGRSAQKIRLTLRSAVGGFHSVKLTRAGAQRLVNAAVTKVLAEIP